MFFKNIVFGSLEDINFKNKDFLTFLKNLSLYSKENNIKIYFLSGFKKEVGDQFVLKYNLSEIFEDNIFHADDVYFSSLLDIDKEIRLEKYKISKEYIDQYFKIYFLNKVKPELNNGNTLFIGKDIWTDAYYISEYSKVNVILLKPFLTFNNEEYFNDLKTLKTINFNFNDFKIFLNKKQDFDYTKLKSFAKNYLINKSIGKLNLNFDLGKIYKKK